MAGILSDNEKKARKLAKTLYKAAEEICLMDEFIDIFYDLSDERNMRIINRAAELLDRRTAKLQKSIDKKLGITERDISGKPIAGRYSVK